MNDLKSLCEKVLKEAKAFHRIHHSPPLTAERLAKAVIVLSEALERQSHPHIEQFCKERAREVITKANEICRGEE